MQYKKQILAQLEKCYAVTLATVDGEPCLLAAAEKRNPCYRFRLDGTYVDSVWAEPGGVMTMVPVPDKDGVFLATHKFYSPNDSAEAKLVCAKKEKDGWSVQTIAELPFVHRFDIIPRNGINYVLACSLKSDHKYKGDWRFPGKLRAGILSEDPGQPLELKVIRENLTHNHGYTRYEENGLQYGIVSADEGVFQVAPPQNPGGEWEITRLLDSPCSDAVRLDLDRDGQAELLTLSPFHGDHIAIWHLDHGQYQIAYEFPDHYPFLHAIYGGMVYGRPTVYVGNREEERLFMGIYYDTAAQQYTWEEVDRGCGPANCLLFERDGHPALLVTNREMDEVAVYDIFSKREGD